MVGGKAEQTEGGEMGVTAITDHTPTYFKNAIK